uniref:Uncharacterized protein n=1 Tax=Timema poppense TaxID=170557 RepID=A0A7R9GZ30_TIMPO|nr:unnamed protein product [Timema poppensis]
METMSFNGGMLHERQISHDRDMSHAASRSCRVGMHWGPFSRRHIPPLYLPHVRQKPRDVPPQGLSSGNMNVRIENSQDNEDMKQEEQTVDKITKTIPAKKAQVSSRKRKLDGTLEKELIQVLSNHGSSHQCNTRPNTDHDEMFLFCDYAAFIAPSSIPCSTFAAATFVA